MKFFGLSTPRDNLISPELGVTLLVQGEGN